MIPCLSGPAPGQDRKDADIPALIRALGGEKYGERDAAMRSLEKLGPPALPHLYKALTGSLETSQRAKSLIHKIREKQAQDAARDPAPFAWDIDDQSLLEVLEETQKKWGVRFAYRADRDKLAAARITLRTTPLPFWQAWDRLLNAAGLVELLHAPEASYEDALEPWLLIARERHESPVFKPGKTPAWTSDCAGPLRVRSLALGERILLELRPRPGSGWLSLEDLRIANLVNAKGETVALSPDLRRAHQAALKSQRGDWQHLLRRERLDSGSPCEAIVLSLPGGPWREIQGSALARLVATHTESCVKDVLHQDKDRWETFDGVRGRILEKRLTDESVLCLRLRFDNYDNWVSHYPGQPVRRLRTGVVVFLTPGDMAAEMLTVTDKRGRPLERLSVVPGTSEDGKGLELEVRYQGPAGGDEVFDLSLLHQRTLTVEFPFHLRDVK
ncbi:MAG: hypothetical protein U0793_19395 [Gemmataceae bacterium]